MSATQTQTTIEVLLLNEAESLSQILYNKPYAELDEERQKLMMTGARKFLRTRMSFPGECCDCGATIDEDKVQCRSCHEGFAPGEWNACERKLAHKGLL
jgi:hypothetical protein